jgi:hypothetical protein
MQCPHCGSPISPGTRFCGGCGSEVVSPGNRPAGAPPVPGPPPPPVPPAPIPYAPAPPPAPDDSLNFAIITLVLYWFFWPAGVVCNIIGLKKPSHHGCFVGMAVLFIALPIVAAVITCIAAVIFLFAAAA